MCRSDTLRLLALKCFCIFYCVSKVERKAKLRDLCNQVPYLTPTRYGRVPKTQENTVLKRVNRSALTQQDLVTRRLQGTDKTANKDKHEKLTTKMIQKKNRHLKVVRKQQERHWEVMFSQPCAMSAAYLKISVDFICVNKTYYDYQYEI